MSMHSRRERTVIDDGGDDDHHRRHDQSSSMIDALLSQLIRRFGILSSKAILIIIDAIVLRLHMLTQALP